MRVSQELVFSSAHSLQHRPTASSGLYSVRMERRTQKPEKSIFAFVLFLICASSVISCVSGCESRTHSEPVAIQDKPPASALPFVLTVATGRAGITLARTTPHDSDLPRRDFYVLLSNVSKQLQTVWEDWNSWGYQTISFELTTADGKKHVVSKRQQGFTKNYPSTLVIEPGEHHVYVIHLDEWWAIQPPIPKTDETTITLKAIYEVSPTPESAQYKVWTGRLESHDYTFSLRQW
jgi:hypothetical protein